MTPSYPDIERHLLVNVASSANTRNSSKALCRSIHVYFLHMTKKLEYFEKKMLTNFLENYVLHCFANLENFATL